MWGFLHGTKVIFFPGSISLVILASLIVLCSCQLAISLLLQGFVLLSNDIYFTNSAINCLILLYWTGQLTF